ncbi:MAG: hypothetical protein FIA99_17435 [Ruminiclostridium sp.]|nr:hypothetical protein [Ruminiclostridium sp.]
MMDGKINSLESIITNPRPDFRQLRKALLRDGLPDYVPFYELFVQNEIMESVLDKRLPDRASTVEFYYKAGYDYVPAWPYVDLKLGSLIDTSSEYPIKDWETFEKYTWPDPGSIGFYEFEEIIPVLPNGMKIIGQIQGILETLQMLVGYVDMCYMMHDEPALIEAIMGKLYVLYSAIYKGMASIKEVGALVISDDMGYKTQTLIGIDELRKYILPAHKSLAEISHNADKPCILHSCGQIYNIMDDIIDDVRIDAKHSYEDIIMPVEKAKEQYGKRVSILGGFDMDRLCRSNAEEIRNYTSMLMDKLGSSGGYALGSGNSIAAYVPADNYLTMLDQGWKIRTGKL